MYVAVKGGEAAIDNAHRLLAFARRGDPAVPRIETAQISEQLALCVDRVMAEGSLYDPEIAALAIRQARGDLIEAVFLVRAYRTTLQRFGASEPVDTGRIAVSRRISATFKDLPGGQVLGPTFDYTHRLIDFDDPEHVEAPPARIAVPDISSLHAVRDTETDGPIPGAKNPASPLSGPSPAPGETANAQVRDHAEPAEPFPRVASLLAAQGLVETPAAADAASAPGDLTREPLSFPAARDLRLQNLARADEGFLLALAYSTQRGFGRTHPFVGEIRFGEIEVEFFAEDVGITVPLGRMPLTECEMVNQFKGSQTAPPQFTTGYGLAFGQSERRAMSMALVDRALRAGEFGEEVKAPAQDEEFVLSHSDNVQATGFVEHLKLPHYVDFQAELGLLRRLREEWAEASAAPAKEPGGQA